MASKPLSWSVVTTARGPSDVTLAFAAHHVAQGARMVYVFLDDFDDPVYPALKALHRTRVNRCSASHWKRINGGPRPDRFEERQELNATSCLGQVQGDWLLHAETNEFLHIGRSLDDHVAQMTDDQVWLRVPQLERVWLMARKPSHIFQGLFRSPVPQKDPLLTQVYGDRLPAFLHGGLAGEARGRPLVRNVEGLRLTHLAPVDETRQRPIPCVARGMALLRYEGFTAIEWAAQMLELAERPEAELVGLRPERRAQIAHVRDHCVDLHKVLAFHRSLFSVSKRQAAALSAEKRLVRPSIDPYSDLLARDPAAADRVTMRGYDEQLGPKAATLLMRKLQATPNIEKSLAAAD